MKNLIATNFVYTVRDSNGNTRIETGSYLGRKRATTERLRAFVRKNIRDTGADLTLLTLSIGNSYESKWIAK